MSEVEVCFATVIGHEHLSVLVGVHRPRVKVDIGVELLHGDSKSTHLEKTTERTGGQPFTERADHTTRYENMLGQLVLRPGRANTRC